MPLIRIGPGYLAGLLGRALPVTGSESDPKLAGFFGPGTRVPVYQRVYVVSVPDTNFNNL